MSNSVATEYADYKSPSALAQDASLSKAERLRILKIWCEDEEQLCIAAAEGMTGGTDSNLKAVQKALDSLAQDITER